MKRLVLSLVVACGSKSPPPVQPVENVAPPAQVEPGAGNAREIQRTAQGGVIELSGQRDAAMRAADEAMERRCGKGAYTITQEGEEAITDVDGKLSGTAWRVHYQCAH